MSAKRLALLVPLVALGFCSPESDKSPCGPALSKEEVIRAVTVELKKRGATALPPKTRIIVSEDGCYYAVLLIDLGGPYGSHLYVRATRSGRVIEIIQGH